MINMVASELVEGLCNVVAGVLSACGLTPPCTSPLPLCEAVGKDETLEEEYT